MKPRCSHHPPPKGDLLDYLEKVAKGLEQRQCPVCLRWFFHGEFGKGWGKGLRHQGQSNIINP